MHPKFSKAAMLSGDAIGVATEMLPAYQAQPLYGFSLFPVDRTWSQREGTGPEGQRELSRGPRPRTIVRGRQHPRRGSGSLGASIPWPLRGVHDLWTQPPGARPPAKFRWPSGPVRSTRQKLEVVR